MNPGLGLAAERWKLNIPTFYSSKVQPAAVGTALPAGVQTRIGVAPLAAFAAAVAQSAFAASRSADVEFGAVGFVAEYRELKPTETGAGTMTYQLDRFDTKRVRQPQLEHREPLAPFSFPASPLRSLPRSISLARGSTEDANMSRFVLVFDGEHVASRMGSAWIGVNPQEHNGKPVVTHD
jgi:hypothetical protein